MNRSVLIACLVAPLLVSANWASAATDAEVQQLRDQLRSTVLQLRQLQDQQAATTAAPQPAAPAPDAGAEKAKVANLEGQLRAARRSAAQVTSLQASLTKAQADNTALTASAAAMSAELEKYKAAYNQSADVGRALAAERDKLKAQLDLSVKISAACQAKNTRLTAFAEDLLVSFRKVGLGDVLGAHEPVFGLRRVQLENIAQEREDKVRSERCDAQVDGAAPKSAPGG